MNKVCGLQATQHFPPHFSDLTSTFTELLTEGKNPWHWQQREPTYRLGHIWDRWWIGCNSRGIEGVSIRVRPDRPSGLTNRVRCRSAVPRGFPGEVWKSRKRETMRFSSQMPLQMHLRSGVAPFLRISDIAWHRFTLAPLFVLLFSARSLSLSPLWLILC